MPTPTFTPWRKPPFAATGTFLFVLAIATVTLGVIGYARVPEALLVGELKLSSTPGTVARALDLFYLGLQLLWMGGRTTFSEPLLLVARWMGALWAFGALVRLLVPHVETRWQRWVISRTHGHSVVIGVGRRGSAFARNLGSAGPVVAIDTEGTEKTLAALGALDAARVWAIEGDARSDDTLIRATVAKAARVIIVTRSDALNLEIARRIAELVNRWRGEGLPLDVLIHVGAAALRTAVLDGEPATPQVRLRQFSLPLLAARRFAWEQAPLRAAREAGRTRAHFAFVGWDDYAEELLVHLLRLGPLARQGMPAITIVAPEAAQVLARLRANYPGLQDILGERLRGFPLDWNADPSAEALGRWDPDSAPRERVSAVIIHPPDDARGVAFAQRLRRAARQHGVLQAPFYLRIDDAAPFGTMFEHARAAKEWAELLVPFGTLDTSCTLAAIDEWHESLAENLHAAYLAEIGDAAHRGRVHPAARPWDALPESFRDSNRRAVDSLAGKLASLGYRVEAMPPVLPANVLDHPAAIEVLARLEHFGWMHEKLLAGWRPALVRDDRRRLHPDLVPYDALHSEQRKDIAQMRAIVAARVGREPNVRRERIIGVVTLLAGAAAPPESLRTGFARLLAQWDAGGRLAGREGISETWTFVVPIGNESALASARALASALRNQLTERAEHTRIIVLDDGGTRAARAFQSSQGARSGALAEPIREFVADEPRCALLIAPPADGGGDTALGTRAAEAYLLANAVELVLVVADPQLTAAVRERLSTVWLQRTALAEPFAPAPIDDKGLWLVNVTTAATPTALAAPA